MIHIISIKYLKDKLNIKENISQIGIRFNEKDLCLVIETGNESESELIYL